MKNFYISNEKIEFLKYIAIIFMFLDHYSSLNLESYNFLKIIGRFVFPLFAIILVYNYIYNTKNKLKYIQRLLLFAVISEPFHYYAFYDYYNSYVINIFFTLSFGLIILYVYENTLNKNIWYKSLIYFYLILLFTPISLFISYNIFGLILILTIYLFIKKTNYITLFCLIISIYLLNYNWHYLYSVVGLLSLIIIYFLPYIKMKRYNKYFFYLFYPIHLFILKLNIF